MELTPEQQLAVDSREPRFTIAASAGSGKTRVLTERYIRLVMEEGLSPLEILTISFTNASAAEMKSRITARLRDLGNTEAAQAAEVGPIQTFDSFCRRILVTNALEAGVDPHFATAPPTHRLMEEAAHHVLDTAFAEGEVGQELLDHYADYPEGLEPDIVELMRFRRNQPFRAESFEPEAVLRLYEQEGPMFAPDLANFLAGTGKPAAWLKGLTVDVGAAYQVMSQLERLAAAGIEQAVATMRQRQEFDYTEIARLAVELLESDLEVRDRVQRSYRALLVDEAQDLNDHQYALIRALQIDQEMLVGDIKQSIYGFRGAAPQLFAERQEALPLLELQRNHRTKTPGILTFIEDICRERLPSVANSSFSLDEDLSYEGVHVWAAGNPEKEPEQLAAQVDILIREHSVSPGDIGILVWAHNHSRGIAEALLERDIPAGVIGGAHFHSLPLIRDMANLLELFGDPTHPFRLFAVLRSPVVGISLDSVMRLQESQDMWEAVNNPPDDLDPGDLTALANFRTWFLPLAALSDRMTAWETLSATMQRSNLVQTIARTPRRIQNLANLRKLMERAAEFSALRPQEFAETIRKAQWEDDKEGQAQTVSLSDPVVKIMTVFGAKGLEFPVTILAGEKWQSRPRSGLRTHRASGLAMVGKWFAKTWPAELIGHLNMAEQEEELWRTYYVALTRACNMLVINVGDLHAKPANAPMEAIRRLARAEITPPGLRVSTHPLRLQGDSVH